MLPSPSSTRRRSSPGNNGVFQPTIVAGGWVVGTWRRKVGPAGITCHEAPDDTSTHWTTRSLAKRFGIGKDAIAGVWADHNLKPWRVDTFEPSTDPYFEGSWSTSSVSI